MKNKILKTPHKGTDKGAVKPRRVQLGEGVGVVIWTDAIGTGSYASTVLKGGRVEIVDFDGTARLFEAVTNHEALFSLLIAQTSISMETPMHVIFCEKFTHKKVRAIVRQIHHLVGRERFENSSIDMRWSDGRAKAQDLFD